MKLENIKKVLENYKLGSLKDCKKISHGFANLNFKITTANGNFLFRINKHQELSTIQYELRVLNELKKINFPTAYPISRRDDRFITVTAEDKIVIYDFIEGEIPDINIRTVSEMATAAARLNSIPNWQKFTKKNAINIDNCFDLMGKFDTAKCKYPEVFKHFSEQTEYLDKYVRENLPQGIIHSDLFPDNTIFKDNKLIAFIDFEEVCTDDLIFEVGMAINGFCRSRIPRWAAAEAALYFSSAAAELRFSANSEISAPETKALSPAPIMTTTRMSSSAWKSFMAWPTASHMAMDTALRRAGLLKISQPTPSSLRAIILSVFSSMVIRAFILGNWLLYL